MNKGALTVNSHHLGRRNLLRRHPIKMELRILVPIMSEPIPLATRLRVEDERVVIHHPRCLVFDLLLERHAAKARPGEMVERQVRGYCSSVGNFAGGGDFDFGGEEVQHAEPVGGAEEAPGIAMGSILAEGEGVK